MKQLLINMGLMQAPAIQKKSVESVLAVFNQTIADLNEVAQEAQIEAKFNTDYAEKIRVRAEQQIAEVTAQADASQKEADRAKQIAERMQDLLK